MRAPPRSPRLGTSMDTVVLLSLLASLNPTLLAATTVMLLLPSPSRLMLGYLLGAMMTSITLGLVIVFSLSGSSTTKTTKKTLSPAVDIALGCIALVIAWVLGSGRFDRYRERRRERKADQPDQAPPRWQQQLSKGSARSTFVVGALLTLPGASYLAALTAIHRLNYSTSVTVVVVIGFNLIMLWLLEVPIAGICDRSGENPAGHRPGQGVGGEARLYGRSTRIRNHRSAADRQGHGRPDRRMIRFASGLRRPVQRGCSASARATPCHARRAVDRARGLPESNDAGAGDVPGDDRSPAPQADRVHGRCPCSQHGRRARDDARPRTAAAFTRTQAGPADEAHHRAGCGRDADCHRGSALVWSSGARAA